MSTKQTDIIIKQGATFQTQYLVKSKDVSGNIIPTDLTGAVVKMEVRKSYASPDLILDLTADSYIYILNPLEGLIEVEIPANITESMSFTNAVYDIKIVFPTGFVSRIAQGGVSLDPVVTRG